MINQKCPYIQHDLYSYDIVSAFPTILQKQFYDFKDVDLSNKQERNIFLGKEQINNKNLSKFLSQSVESLIDFYLQENNLSESEIIVTQKDGFIISKLLDNDDEFINMKFRGFIDFLIISIDRKKILYAEDGDIIIKGMPHFYPGLNKFYNMFQNINFYNKKILFEQLENIKNTILNCEEKEPFLIPVDDYFVAKTFKGDLKIKSSDFISISSIDKMKYFDHFLSCFLKPILLECF